MKSIEVLSAILNEETGFIEVIKLITNDDDSTEFAGHSIPLETMEWWSAVYGIEDQDELIDIILYEPYVENVSPMQMSEKDARDSHRSKITAFKEKNHKPISKSKAAIAIRNSNVDNKYADDAPEDPYQFIKDACPFDAEVIEIKKQHIQRIREENEKSRSKLNPNRLGRKDELLKRMAGPGREVKEIKEDKRPSAPPAVVLEKGKRIK